MPPRKKAATKVAVPKKKKEVVVEEEVEEEVSEIEEELAEAIDESPEELILKVEELPSDEEIFDDGPTAGEIVEWKKTYGEVYLTAVDYDTYVIWRTMNRGEYKQHVKTMSELTSTGRMSEIEASLFNEEAICEMCALHPKMSASTMTNQMAGVPALITQQVMEASGFMALEVRQL